mgnify:CR=1 FL=1
MEWYEIVISAVATLGGVGGFISIYKAKPEKTSIEVQNMKEMLDASHRMYDEMNTPLNGPMAPAKTGLS